MIYHFQLTSDEKPDFFRKISISADSTFEELHQAIQGTSSFHSDQLASFFIADENWSKKVEVTLLDMEFNNEPAYIMRRTRLNELVKDSHQRMLYVFDFFNDRAFYVELIGISMKENLTEPVVSFAKGNAPEQYYEDEDQDQAVDLLDPEDLYQDYGDLDDFTEIYGEMNDLSYGE